MVSTKCKCIFFTIVGWASLDSEAGGQRRCHRQGGQLNWMRRTRKTGCACSTGSQPGANAHRHTAEVAPQ
jgi:hypothetical protein